MRSCNHCAGACFAILLVTAAAAGNTATHSDAVPGLRQRWQLWEGAPLQWRQRQLAAASSQTKQTQSQSSASNSKQAAGAAASEAQATASTTDWIALLSEATAIVTSPQLGQVVPAQSAAGATVVLDGSSSTPERGGAISSYDWVVRSLADGRMVRDAQGPKVELLLPAGSYRATLTVSSSKKTDSGSGKGSDSVLRFTVSAWAGAEQAAAAGSTEQAAAAGSAQQAAAAGSRPGSSDTSSSANGISSESSGNSSSRRTNSSLDGSSGRVNTVAVSEEPVDYTALFRPWLQPPSPAPAATPGSSQAGGVGGGTPESPSGAEAPDAMATPAQQPGAAARPPAAGPPDAPQPAPAAEPRLDGTGSVDDPSGGDDYVAAQPPQQAAPPAAPAPVVVPVPEPVQPVMPVPVPPPMTIVVPTPQPEPVTAPATPRPPPPPPPPPPPAVTDVPAAAPGAVPVVQPSPPPPPPPSPPPPFPPPPSPPPPPPPPSVNDAFCNPNKDYDLSDSSEWNDMKSCCDSATRASVVDPECAALPPQPAAKPPPPVPAPVPPPAPTGPSVDESYCDPNNDYNLGNSMDWDDMNSCCGSAREKSIQDSQCNSLPPRPAAAAAPTPAPTPSGASQLVEDYCVGSDYDFSKQEDREYWQDCCGDAAKQNVADSECQKPQW